MAHPLTQDASPDTLKYEKQLWQQKIEFIAGVDEVGRGPLAGPVVAAAVIFRKDALLPPESVVIDDSKKLSEKQRLSAYTWIIKNALAFGVGMVEPAEIDRINIRQAAMQAMRKAVQHLAIQPHHLLIDGRAIENPPVPQTAIVKGDQLSISIAAASIVAKVVRDQVMLDYHQQYPDYFFDRNKGYPTQAHLNAILRHGLCPIHRRSFRPKKLEAMGFYEK